jgi:hypothetical protein
LDLPLLCQRFGIPEHYGAFTFGDEWTRLVAGNQDQKRTNDAIATTVAVVIFWPAAFLVGGDGPAAAELGKGPNERR